jgi:hypothetical protein
MNQKSIAYAALALTAMAACAFAATTDDVDGLVSVETSVVVDSVTIGERFAVRYDFTYPDTLRMVPVGEVEIEKSRVLSLVWSEETDRGMTSRRADMTIITLDLEGARIPEVPFDFVSPSGDTIRALASGWYVPVRLVAADSAGLKPLKDQWNAPPNVLIPALAAVAAIALAALIWWLWGRRRASVTEAPPVPVLPADYVALTELTRIEKLGLLERGEFKSYYTLVVDAVRNYLNGRFGVDAMDRTTEEVLDDVRDRGVQVEPLEPLLREADLVKFAKHVPTRDNGTAAMHSAREVVTKTAPRRNPALVQEENDGAKEQVG